MTRRVALGAFVFDPTSGTLARHGLAVPLGGRAQAVLAALAESEETLTKQEILDRAWPGVTVEEGNLTVHVAALRKILGDDAIVTVPRVGYRLRRGSPQAPGGLPKLAVLAFETIGGEPGDGYFADGLAEDLITALGRYRQLVVLSRQAARARGDHLNDAGVRYVLGGTLRRAGGQLRIAAHLVETADGRELWSRRMDGELHDLFAIQDRITEAVAGAVAPEIEAAEIAEVRQGRPASVKAYDLYLRALPEIYCETEAGNLRAEALLGRALEIEPENGLFLAHLAWVLEHRHTMCLPSLAPGDRERAIACARAALQHAHGDARTLCHAAATLCLAGGEYELGVAVIERALAENPNNTMVLVNAGVILMQNGDLDRAESIMKRCLELSPGDPMLHIPWCGLAHIALRRGDHATSVENAVRALAANPSFDPAHWVLIASLAHQGRVREAAEALARFQSQTPGVTVARLMAAETQLLTAQAEPLYALYEGLRLAGLPEE